MAQPATRRSLALSTGRMGRHPIDCRLITGEPCRTKPASGCCMVHSSGWWPMAVSLPLLHPATASTWRTGIMLGRTCQWAQGECCSPWLRLRRPNPKRMARRPGTMMACTAAGRCCSAGVQQVLVASAGGAGGDGPAHAGRPRPVRPPRDSRSSRDQQTAHAHSCCHPRRAQPCPVFLRLVTTMRVGQYVISHPRWDPLGRPGKAGRASDIGLLLGPWHPVCAGGAWRCTGQEVRQLGHELDEPTSALQGSRVLAWR